MERLPLTAARRVWWSPHRFSVSTAAATGHAPFAASSEARSAHSAGSPNGLDRNSVGSRRTSVGRNRTLVGGSGTPVGRDPTPIGGDGTLDRRVPTPVGEDGTPVGRDPTLVGGDRKPAGRRRSSESVRRTPNFPNGRFNSRNGCSERADRRWISPKRRPKLRRGRSSSANRGPECAHGRSVPSNRGSECARGRSGSPKRPSERAIGSSGSPNAGSVSSRIAFRPPAGRIGLRAVLALPPIRRFRHGRRPPPRGARTPIRPEEP